MTLTKQLALITSLLFWVAFVCSSNDKVLSEQSLLEKLDEIKSLVVSQPEKALAILDQLRKNEVKLNVEQKVQLIVNEVVANTYLNRHMVALELTEKLKVIGEKENDKRFLWHYFTQKAIVYWHMDSVEESLKFSLKAYDVVKAIDEFRDYQAESEGNIGYRYIKLGFHQEAVTYLESELEFVLTQDNVINIASSYNNLGEAYLGLKNYQKSLELLEKALAIRIKHQLTFHLSYSYQNFGRLYYVQKKYQQAETAFNKAIEIREQANFVKGLLVSKLSLSEVYIAQNEVNLALKVIEEIITTAKVQNNDTSLSTAYDLQRKIYESKKDYHKAYQATLHYQQTIERVVSRKTSTKLAGYLNTSEVISKDLNIMELEKDAEIKELQVNSERQKANFIIVAGFCLILFLVIFLWSVQKSKRAIAKSNSKLSLTLEQLKQTQAELIKSGKMSALTTLVSRMAHQVNTPLGIAVTGVSHIHEKVDHFELLVKAGKVRKSEIDSLITDLNKGCELSSTSMNKVAGLMSQFKTISDSLEAEIKQEFDIFELLSKQADLILMLQQRNKPEINIKGSSTLLFGYPEALNKVFNQLITNSIAHAFDDTLTPKIEIEIAKINETVEIIYQDNGKGIDATAIKDVFEPFHNTTMSNKNLGIGLSIVYNLVVQLMQGNIQCKQNREKGIMFCISLPLTLKPA